MSLGTILFSAAVVIVSAAFVARPFRRDRADVDRVIDAWVRQARAGNASAGGSGADEAEGRHDEAFLEGESAAITPEAVSVERETVGAAQIAPADADEAVSFCPYCGRQVEPDHVFCPKCGRQLVKGDRS